MFEKVMEIVNPEQVFIIKPKVHDPQEIKGEEVKNDENLIDEVTRECREFLNDQSAYEIAYESEVEDLIKQKAILVQTMEQFKNSKYGYQDNYK